jgi:putative ABC transport system permease protein
MRYPLSRVAYRALMRLYPSEFRDRFATDLEADFAELLTERGRRVAWMRAIADFTHSLGLTHTDAQASARRRLFTHPPGESSMAALLFDLRHAVRALLNAPAFTAVTIITLALGIGANSAIFSLVSAVLIRPLGYHDPAGLMLIHEGIPSANLPRFGVSPPDFADLVSYQQSFAQIGAYRNRSMELSGIGDGEQVTAAEVTPSVFPLLGVNAAAGRTLLPADGNEQRIVVLAHGLWQRRFGGREVVGERVTLDRQPYTIVGIMPPAFEFPKRGPELNGEPADLWVPLVFNPFERQARGMFYNHSVIGRLKDGVPAEQAAVDVAALAGRIRDNYPTQLRNAISLVVEAAPLVDEVSGAVRRPLLVLLGAVGLVLLVACANVANLFLTRAVSRTREIGLRVALGAERRRLFQMLATESLLLTLAAGVLGLLLGHWAVRAMPTAIAASLPGVSGVTLDIRVVTFTLALSALTAMVFGLVPLLGARRNLNEGLREGSSRVSGRVEQRRLQAGLVVTSVAFAFVLLVGAGLLLRSFNNLMAVDVGVHAADVLTVKVSLPFAGYNTATPIRTFYRSLHERLAVLPGVRAASIATDVPVSGDGERRSFWPESAPDGTMPPSVAVTWIHGGYFETYGIPLRRGRWFSREEEADNRHVAVINESLAARFWPGQDAIGTRFKWGLASSPAPWKTIIGVVGDVVEGPLGADPIIHIYVPYSDVPDAALSAPLAGLLRQMTVAVHSDTDPTRLTAPVRAAIAALDPALAMTDVTTMAQVVSDASAPQRFSAMALGAFAGGALLMAAIGLYGVLAFGVSRRTREIGVRLALGAKVSEVVTLVLREGMTLALTGLVLGFAGSVAAVRLIASQLYATEVYDLTTFVLVAGVLFLVALLACYVPARRAARVNPITALRAE